MKKLGAKEAFKTLGRGAQCGPNPDAGTYTTNRGSSRDRTKRVSSRRERGGIDGDRKQEGGATGRIPSAMP